jgi:hypothetical protein
MDTLLVRLKSYDPRRGFVLRRFTYAGIRFQGEHGWCRVEKSVADRLRTTRCVASDPHSPLAFDVCTEAEAKALEDSESEAAKVKRSATDDLKVVPARASALTTVDLPSKSMTSTPAAKDDDKDTKRSKRE